MPASAALGISGAPAKRVALDTRERLDLARLQLRVRGERRQERDLHFAGEHGGERVARALVGMCCSGIPVMRFNELAREVAGRAVAGGGVGEIALLLRVGDEFLRGR